MELETVDRPIAVADGGDRAGRRGRQPEEVAADGLDLVAVAHPDDRLMRDVVEQRLVRVEDTALGPPELAPRRVRLDLAPHRLADQLHAVADAENGNVQAKNGRVAVGGTRLVDARRAAREDQRQRVERADTFRRDVVANDPSERVPLADPTRDELDVLRTEIEDQYRSRCDVGIPIHASAILYQ